MDVQSLKEARRGNRMHHFYHIFTRVLVLARPFNFSVGVWLPLPQSNPLPKLIQDLLAKSHSIYTYYYYIIIRLSTISDKEGESRIPNTTTNSHTFSGKGNVTDQTMRFADSFSVSCSYRQIQLFRYQHLLTIIPIGSYNHIVTTT